MFVINWIFKQIKRWVLTPAYLIISFPFMILTVMFTGHLNHKGPLFTSLFGYAAGFYNWTNNLTGKYVGTSNNSKKSGTSNKGSADIFANEAQDDFRDSNAWMNDPSKDFMSGNLFNNNNHD